MRVRVCVDMLVLTYRAVSNEWQHKKFITGITETESKKKINAENYTQILRTKIDFIYNCEVYNTYIIFEI